MKSIYVSEGLPRLALAFEDDLRRAIEGGLLEESHFLDLKREVKAGKGENRELARDLASFAIDSGTLLVGIDEASDGSFQLAPQPLGGLAERVEQVAAMVPDPPLAVITRRISSSADPAVGYLVVHVPASPAAPHMIDGRYLGRGDKTKRYLSDPEVLRLHERRRSAEADALALLDAEFARDPVPSDQRDNAHLFMLAEPLAGRPEMLLHLTNGPGRMLEYLRSHGMSADLQRVFTQAQTGGFSPDIDVLADFDRRPTGAALMSYGLEPGRRLRTDVHSPGQESLVELEVHEDGGLRLFMGRLSDRLGRRSLGDSEPKEAVFFEAAAVIYARRFVALVLGGSRGGWLLRELATGVRRNRTRWNHVLRDAGVLPNEGGTVQRGRVPTRDGLLICRTAEPTRQRGRAARSSVAPILRDAPDVRHRAG